MKFNVVFLVLFHSANFAFAADCSVENLNKLLKLSAESLGYNSEFYVKALKTSREAAKANKSAKELNEELLAISKKSSEKALSAISQIEALIKSNPECDKENLFSLKSK